MDQNTRYYDNAHKLRFLTITSLIPCISVLLCYCYIVLLLT